MAKTRSPNYPNINFSEALEAVRPVFRAENRNKMSRIVLAAHMGYSSLNGRALGKIGAIRAYGLIEGSGDELRLSADAITALNAPRDSSERMEAIARCAFKPSLFAELRAEFPDTQPSMENLRFNLVKRGFTETAAEKAAANYLSSFELVDGEPNGAAFGPAKDTDYQEPTTDRRGPTAGSPLNGTPRSMSRDHPDQPNRPDLTSGMKQDVYTLKEGDVVIQWPDRISRESFEDIEAWMQLILRKIKRHVAENFESKETAAESEGPE